MTENHFLIGAVLIALLGGISDVRSSRIPNWLTYSGLLVALLLRFVGLGWAGFRSGVVGMLVAGVLFCLLFMMGAMGGGDVKLIASVGAWVGNDQVVAVLLAAMLAGGLLAVIYIFFGQRPRQTLRNVFDLIRFRVTSGLTPHPLLNVKQEGTLRVPFGVAVAMGTLFCAGNAIWWR